MGFLTFPSFQKILSNNRLLISFLVFSDNAAAPRYHGCIRIQERLEQREKAVKRRCDNVKRERKKRGGGACAVNECGVMN